MHILRPTRSCGVLGDAAAGVGQPAGPRLALGLVLLAGALAAACVSPEASRTRASGPGGDVGNRRERVEIHGRTDPAYETPRVGLGVERAGQDVRPTDVPQSTGKPGR